MRAFEEARRTAWQAAMTGCLLAMAREIAAASPEPDAARDHMRATAARFVELAAGAEGSPAREIAHLVVETVFLG